MDTDSEPPAHPGPSTATRVLVVSDTHLSSRTPEAIANWDAVVAHVAAGDHDVVLHVGDVTVDGAARDDDLDVARHELGRLDARLRVVPGNHDIGDNPFAAPGPAAVAAAAADPDHERPVSPDRLGRYRARLGPDRWALDVPGWRVVGCNSLLFGSGLDDEAEQWAWLADVLPAPGRRVALVLHKPLEAPPPGTDVAPYRYVPPAAATRLRSLLPEVGDLGLVVSGHVHQHLRYERDGVTYLWAPTTWAVLPDRLQTTLGEKTCGVVELELPGDAGPVDSTLVRPSALNHHVLLDTIPSPY